MARSRTSSAIALVALSLATADMHIAHAVSLSSGDGYGDQHVTAWYSMQAKSTGRLASTAGKPVYLQSRHNFTPAGIGGERLTGDVTQTSYVNVGGVTTVNTAGATGTLTWVEWAVCRNINNLPDRCGTFRREYR